MNDAELFNPGNVLRNTDSIFPCRLTGAEESEIEGEQCGKIAGVTLENQQETER